MPQIVGHIFSWLPKTSSSCRPHYLTSSGQYWPLLDRGRGKRKRKRGRGANCNAGQVLHSRTIVSCETFQLLVIIYSTSKRKLLATVLAPLLRLPSPAPPAFHSSLHCIIVCSCFDFVGKGQQKKEKSCM